MTNSKKRVPCPYTPPNGEPCMTTRSVISGPLMDICLAINRAVRTPDGNTAFCTLAAAATRDVLLAKGWNADVLRVEAALFPDSTIHCVILGGDGDGTWRI